MKNALCLTLIFGAFFGAAQTLAQTPVSSASQPDPFAMYGGSQKMIDFLATFKADIRSNNTKDLARIGATGKNFTPTLQTKVLDSTINDWQPMGSQGIMLGSGLIWLQALCTDSTCKNIYLTVSGIN